MFEIHLLVLGHPIVVPVGYFFVSVYIDRFSFQGFLYTSIERKDLFVKLVSKGTSIKDIQCLG